MRQAGNARGGFGLAVHDMQIRPQPFRHARPVQDIRLRQAAARLRERAQRAGLLPVNPQLAQHLVGVRHARQRGRFKGFEKTPKSPLITPSSVSSRVPPASKWLWATDNP